MRTTFEIGTVVLQAATDLARQQRPTVGEVRSDLDSPGLRAAMAPSSVEAPASLFRFRSFSPRGTPIATETIDRLREESGQ